MQSKNNGFAQVFGEQETFFESSIFSKRETLHLKVSTLKNMSNKRHKHLPTTLIGLNTP